MALGRARLILTGRKNRDGNRVTRIGSRIQMSGRSLLRWRGGRGVRTGRACGAGGRAARPGGSMALGRERLILTGRKSRDGNRVTRIGSRVQMSGRALLRWRGGRGLGEGIRFDVPELLSVR